MSYTKLRKRLFEKNIKRFFETSKSHLGASKFQSGFPALVLNYDEDDIMGGYYCHDLNEMQINYQGWDDSVECFEYYAKLVYHEFIHYHQSPAWFKRYYKMGHDYLSHPYEIEAYSKENEILNIINYDNSTENETN